MRVTITDIFIAINPFMTGNILKSVIPTYDTCENIENTSIMIHKFMRYSKESCKLSRDEDFTIEYIQSRPLLKEISPKYPGCLKALES